MKRYTLFYSIKDDSLTRSSIFDTLEDFEQFFIDLFYEFESDENPVIELERLVVEVKKNA